MVNLVTKAEREKLIAEAQRLIQAGYSQNQTAGLIQGLHSISWGRARSYAAHVVMRLRGDERRRKLRR